MGLLEVARVDGCLPSVLLAAGEHFLGRGPLLQITDTKVSRGHSKINITDEGEVALTALHAIPCFVRERGGEWTSLEQHQSKRITQNMQIKFTENLWHFNFSLVADKGEEEKADSAKATDDARQEGANKPVDVDSETIQPSKDAIEELDLNTEAEGIRRLRKVLNKPSDLIKKTSDSKTELSTTIESEQSENNSENKGIRSLGKVLNKPPNLISKISESESSKLTTIEPEKSKPIATKSPKKRQLPDWLLKMTAENGISPLHSSPKKRNVEKDSTAAKSAQKVKKSPPISTATSLITSTASTSAGDNPNSDAPVSCSVKSPAKKNKFPVLVTPEDFQDSEDDGEKENKVKQKKDTQKVREPSRPSCPHGASCYRKKSNSL